MGIFGFAPDAAGALRNPPETRAEGSRKVRSRHRWTGSEWDSLASPGLGRVGSGRSGSARLSAARSGLVGEVQSPQFGDGANAPSQAAGPPGGGRGTGEACGPGETPRGWQSGAERPRGASVCRPSWAGGSPGSAGAGALPLGPEANGARFALTQELAPDRGTERRLDSAG